jgi:hypothetical protein
MRDGGGGQKDRQRACAQAHTCERHAAEVGKFASSRHLCRAGLDVAPAAGVAGLERILFFKSLSRLFIWWSMIFSENRFPLFGIMLYARFSDP